MNKVSITLNPFNTSKFLSPERDLLLKSKSILDCKEKQLKNLKVNPSFFYRIYFLLFYSSDSREEPVLLKELSSIVISFYFLFIKIELKTTSKIKKNMAPIVKTVPNDTFTAF